MAPIFTSEFNHFENINATQAWSLFFTVSKEEDRLGNNPMIGRYLTVGLLSAAIAYILEIALFSA